LLDYEYTKYKDMYFSLDSPVEKADIGNFFKKNKQKFEIVLSFLFDSSVVSTP